MIWSRGQQIGAQKVSHHFFLSEALYSGLKLRCFMLVLWLAVPLVKNRLLPMYRNYLEAQRQRLMYKPIAPEPSIEELRDVTIVFPGGPCLNDLETQSHV